MNSSAAFVPYRVTHATVYTYEEAVSRSQQLLHLAPRAHPRQRCLEHAIEIDPLPARRFDRVMRMSAPKQGAPAPYGRSGMNRS